MANLAVILTSGRHRHEPVYSEGPADCFFKIQGVTGLSIFV